MIKRVNFTGRRRIPRRNVEAVVDDGPPRRFTARIDLAGLDLPGEAAVVLEATSAGSNVVERIACGSVSELHQPTNQTLYEAEGENVFFALKVIDNRETIGRILGIAENIRAERAGAPTPGGRRGILPIEPFDLKQELWRLEFKGKNVFLYVNKDIPFLKERAQSDPLFYSVVYPEVVRRLLTKAIDSGVEMEEEEEGWEVLWLRFGRDLHPTKDEPPSAVDPEENKEAWIEEVVEAFCAAHQLADKFGAKLREEEESEP